METTAPIDTFNKFMVGLHGSNLTIMNRTNDLRSLSRSDAYNLASYLVSMAECLPANPDSPTFEQVLAAVQSC